MSDQHHFTYHGVELALYYHMYNLTHLNERAVEVAVAHWWLDQMPEPCRERGIEVGNVLGHYTFCEHDVLDLHEPPTWYQQPHQQVFNEDIFSFPLRRQWLWACSISTIEHTADPVKAIEILKDLTLGKLLVTFPMGEREELDGLVLRGEWQDVFARGCTIARTEEGGWEQTPEVEWRPYGPWANSVFVGEWEAS